MIKGMHGLFYTPQAEEARAFFRDKLGFDCVDAGEGWLIFDVAAAEFGVHPSEQTDSNPTKHQLSFWCDDIETTVGELKDKGVEFLQDVEDHGYGLVTYLAAPGGLKIQLYEPRHAQPK